MNKTITTFLAAISIVASPAALAITIGGVDFGPLGEDPSRTHLETASSPKPLSVVMGKCDRLWFHRRQWRYHLLR